MKEKLINKKIFIHYERYVQKFSKTTETEQKEQPVVFNYNVCAEIKKPIVKVAKKPIENDYKVLAEDNPKEYSKKGFYGWQSHKKYYIKTIRDDFGYPQEILVQLFITDNVGGCGVQQLYSWSTECNNPLIEKVFNHVMKDLHDGTSIILCQVGSKYYNSLFVKILEKNGFGYSEEYYNKYHNNGDTGRIYTKLIK